MMKRSLYTFLAAAAISAPAMIAPALVTPAAAQVGVNVNIGLPAIPMSSPHRVPAISGAPATGVEKASIARESMATGLTPL